MHRRREPLLLLLLLQLAPNSRQMQKKLVANHSVPQNRYSVEEILENLKEMVHD